VWRLDGTIVRKKNDFTKEKLVKIVGKLTEGDGLYYHYPIGTK
jgi:hypothetical protein